jgi:hypothetical protein
MQILKQVQDKIQDESDSLPQKLPYQSKKSGELTKLCFRAISILRPRRIIKNYVTSFAAISPAGTLE